MHFNWKATKRNTYKSNEIKEIKSNDAAYAIFEVIQLNVIYYNSQVMVNPAICHAEVRVDLTRFNVFVTRAKSAH